MPKNKYFSGFSKHVMAIQLSCLYLQESMPVQPTDMPTRGYKTGRYITELQSMYLRRCEQLYVKQTIQTYMKN